MADAIMLDVHGREVRLSSPDKEYFPGITKQQVAEYVMTVGEGMLSALRDRPTTMERWPGGFKAEVTPNAKGGFGDAFYQKRLPKGAPEWVQTAEITFPSGRKAVTVAPADVATLVWMVNLGTLRFHAWPVRAADTGAVDQMRIDLDPQPGTDFGDAIRAAHALRDVMGDAGLTPFIKTSGGRGLHVFAPIKPVDFIEARHAAISIGRRLARQLPDHVTVNWWKEERGERIFVDYNQMARDRLMASAYSIRPTAKATVSAPLAWDELDSVQPEDFTVKTMPARYELLADCWSDYSAVPPASIKTALEWWEEDVERGEGEMPYPPDYPKMPGEPPRVQPSRAKKG